MAQQSNKKAVKNVDQAAQKAINHLAISGIIKNPRITEKATNVASQNVYTFNVTEKATKTQIKEAIQKLYKVKPIKVNVVTLLQRAVFVRGKKGKEAGGRKAYVYLKKGDKIELI